MSAAEDDTELRDLLIQNLEKSGIMNKLKVRNRTVTVCGASDAAASTARLG